MPQRSHNFRRIAYVICSIVLLALATTGWLRSYFRDDAMSWVRERRLAPNGFDACRYGIHSSPGRFHLLLRAFRIPNVDVLNNTGAGHVFDPSTSRSEICFESEPVTDTPPDAWRHLGFATDFDDFSSFGKASRRDIAVPYYFIFLISALMPLKLAVATSRRVRRRRQGRCLECGYDVRVNSGRCPECGCELGAGDLNSGTEKGVKS